MHCRTEKLWYKVTILKDRYIFYWSTVATLLQSLSAGNSYSPFARKLEHSLKKFYRVWHPPKSVKIDFGTLSFVHFYFNILYIFFFQVWWKFECKIQFWYTRGCMLTYPPVNYVLNCIWKCGEKNKGNRIIIETSSTTIVPKLPSSA